MRTLFLNATPARLAAFSLAEVLVLYVMVTVLQNDGRPYRDSARIWLPFLLATAPGYALIVWRLAAHPTDTAGLGIALGIAVCAVGLIIWQAIAAMRSEWGPLVVIMFVLQFNFTLAMAAFVFIPTQVRLAIVASGALRERGVLVPGVMIGVAFAALYVIAVPRLLQPVLRASVAHSRTTAFSASTAQRHLFNLYRCLRDSAGPGAARGFPADEAALRSLGPTCWDPGIAPDGSEYGTYYDFRYVPGPRDADGKIRSFGMAVKERTQGKRFIRSYFIDEQGILRLDEYAWATAATRRIEQNRSTYVVQLMGYLDAWRGMHGAFPKRFVLPLVAGTQPAEGDMPAPNTIPTPPLTYGPDGASVVSRESWLFTYVPRVPGPDGRPTAYNLSVRADNRIINDVRSFFVDDAGRIHGTGENRAATADDPVIPETEPNPEVRANSRMRYEQAIDH